MVTVIWETNAKNASLWSKMLLMHGFQNLLWIRIYSVPPSQKLSENHSKLELQVLRVLFSRMLLLYTVKVLFILPCKTAHLNEIARGTFWDLPRILRSALHVESSQHMNRHWSKPLSCTANCMFLVVAFTKAKAKPPPQSERLSFEDRLVFSSIHLQC